MMWGECDLRTWMNEDFVNEAFCPEELSVIAKSKIRTIYDRKGKDNYHIITEDRVFALSKREVKKYFINNADRMATVTPYANKQLGDIKRRIIKNSNNAHSSIFDEANVWWLRWVGYSLDSASYIRGDGSVDKYGTDVDAFVFVRPALWIKL